MSQEMSIAYAVRGSMRVRNVFPSFKMPESMKEAGVAHALDEIGSADHWSRDFVIRVFDRHRLGVGEDGIARRM